MLQYTHLLFLLFSTTKVMPQLNFTCTNGKPIHISKFCNGRQDCDGSDKIISFSPCLDCLVDNKTSCSIERQGLVSPPCLIDREYICDGLVSCFRLDPCNAHCPDFYRCQDGGCVKRSTLCDGEPLSGCKEDDGWKTGIGFQCLRNGDLCRLPQQLVWDGVQDCDQGEDLCYSNDEVNFVEGRDQRFLPSSAFNQSRCFQCLDQSMIIPRHKVCDDVIDCTDLSDECLCEGDVPVICNDVIARGPEKNSETISLCAVGQVSCGDGSCLARSSVCDSIGDCKDNRDERFSYCRGTLRCSQGMPDDQGSECRCDADYVNTVGVVCNGLDECPIPGLGGKWAEEPGYPDDECKATCPNGPLFNCTTYLFGANGVPEEVKTCLAFDPPGSNLRTMTEVYSTSFCDAILDCSVNGEDEMNCKDRYRCRAGKLVSISTSQVCDGIEDCNDGSDESNATCPHRFFCPSRKTKVSIRANLRCDSNINCDDSSDEIDCNDGRFYCENGVPLFVSGRQVFDGRADCSDLSDECPTETNQRDEIRFSSRYKLIANPILRALVWIMGMLALGGNGIVIVGTGLKVGKVWRKHSNVLLRTNLMLILSLALADFLMGVYLLVLGISEVVYDGIFCAHELEWLSGSTCTGMGVLVVLSSEASVLTMVLFTTFRLYSVIKPFQAKMKPGPYVVLFLIAIVWSIAFVLALVPLSTKLEYIFTDKAIIENNPFFRSIIVNFESAQTWIAKLPTFQPNFSSASLEIFSHINSATNWKSLNIILGNSSATNYFTISAYLGYYSANSVCIPRLFVTTQDKSWQFSIAITIFNFLAFLYVASIYVFIVFHQRRNSAKRAMIKHNETADKRIIALQKKVIRLVITDFCCWVPISIMAFIHFSGSIVPSIAYVISAIVLLPINSALNPLLYSNVLDKLLHKAKTRVATSRGETMLFSSTSRSPNHVTTAIAKL